MTTIHSDGTRPRPPVVGGLVYLVMNMFIGIGAFVTLVTLFAVGVGTAIVWVGLPVLAVAILACRGGARMERVRVFALLNTYIATPYPVLPSVGRWKARVNDGATWRDLAYFVLLLPVGIIEFTVMVSFWSVALGLTLLPVYFRYLPGGEWRIFDWDRPWLIVDSTVEALPFALLGVVVLALALALTKGMATAHALFARALLGPSPSSVDRYDHVGGV